MKKDKLHNVSAIALLAGLTTVFLPGCSIMPNYHQAMESNFAETETSLAVLSSLDSGDVAKTRRAAMIPVFEDFDFLRFCTINGEVSLTPKQKQAWTKLARETLDYTLRHRDVWASNPLDVQYGIRGLRYILTEPEDVRRINELSDYLARAQQKGADTQKTTP